MPELKRKLKKKHIILEQSLSQGVNDLGKLASALYQTSPRNKKARTAASRLRYLMEWRRREQGKSHCAAQTTCERIR